MRKVTEDVLRALGADSLIRLLPPVPQGPPPPPPPRPYWEEDAGFLKGQDAKPHPADDDALHIRGHQDMLNGPPGTVIDKGGRDMAERHIRFHVAQQIQKAGQAEQQKAALQQQLTAPLAMHGPIPMGAGA